MGRAYTVSRGDLVCGHLAEGPGAFVSAARSGLEAPRLPHAGFVSRAAHQELAISEALIAASSFDDALAALRAAGFALEPDA